MTQPIVIDQPMLDERYRYLTASDSDVTGHIYLGPEGFGIDDLRQSLVWVPEAGTHDGGVRFAEFYTLGGASYFLSVYVFAQPPARRSPSYLDPMESTEPLSLVTTASTPQAEALGWIREATHLSLERIARLLGVSRQALNAWRRHGPITDSNWKRLAAVRDVLQRAQRQHPTSATLGTWLDTPSDTDARTPAQLIEAGDIDKARMLAVSSPSLDLSTRPAWANQPVPESFRSGIERLPSGEDALPPDQEDLPFTQLLDMWRATGASEESQAE